LILISIVFTAKILTFEAERGTILLKTMLSHQDQMQIISNCPICNSRNFPAQIKMVTENGDTHLLHVTCRKCQSSLLVLVTLGAQGLASMGVLTGLTSDDVLKFASGSPVSADEILDFWQTSQSPGMILKKLEKAK
jgi:hypothetical protein